MQIILKTECPTQWEVHKWIRKGPCPLGSEGPLEKKLRRWQHTADSGEGRDDISSRKSSLALYRRLRLSWKRKDGNFGIFYFILCSPCPALLDKRDIQLFNLAFQSILAQLVLNVSVVLWLWVGFIWSFAGKCIYEEKCVFVHETQ